MVNKEISKTVTCCKDCPFYDDGHGNERYVSGMSVEQPHCTHPNLKRWQEIKNNQIVPKWCPLKAGAYHKAIVTIIKLLT